MVQEILLHLHESIEEKDDDLTSLRGGMDQGIEHIGFRSKGHNNRAPRFGHTIPCGDFPPIAITAA